MPFAVLICLECICLVSSLSLVLSCITKSCPDPSNIGQNISKMNIFSTKTLKKQNLAKILQNYCHLCPPGNCPYRFQNSVLSWFPGRDETGNTVSSRLVLRFWINWKSRLVSNLDFRRLKSLVLSWKAFCCLDLSWIYLSCLDVLACLVLKKFQDFVPVSSCLVSRFFCPDPSLRFPLWGLDAGQFISKLSH